jgi:hypothetical protein
MGGHDMLETSDFLHNAFELVEGRGSSVTFI